MLGDQAHHFHQILNALLCLRTFPNGFRKDRMLLNYQESFQHKKTLYYQTLLVPEY